MFELNFLKHKTVEQLLLNLIKNKNILKKCKNVWANRFGYLKVRKVKCESQNSLTILATLHGLFTVEI